MNQSREVLTIMNENSNSGSDYQRQTTGCYVSKKAGVVLSVFALGAVMSTAMLVYYTGPPTEATATPQSQQVAEKVDSLYMGGFESLKENEDVDIRLPTSIKPQYYVIHLQPFINGDFTIKGSTEITINIVEATSSITLHMVNITVESESIKVNPLNDLSSPGISVSSLSTDEDSNFFIVQLEEELSVGQTYVISMKFVSYLNNQLAGFYRSKYINDAGNLTWLAVTQFEPTDARKAFPCFDEPALKATFEIYVARETNMTAISNMPKIGTVPFADGSDWVWDHFNTSLPMSTYLVAIAVSDFVNLNSTANDHVLFRAWARESSIDQVEYARNAAPEVLTFYEEYFDVPFPLPKQDMIALPDFAAGAMENWGLITYREADLLYDPVLSSESNKERVLMVIAHELAHQWFGDLVTLEWWTDLWLNEGFATYVNYLGTDSYEPTWNYLDQFVVTDLQEVLVLDSQASSHPISVPVNRPEEITQLFDDISYSKGASILRMLNHSLTENTFRKGLTKYLKIHKYGNANQDDLWAALTTQAHVDGNLPFDITVKMIMDTWTLQMGYPVLNVALNGDGTATLTPERFLLAKNPSSNDTHDYKWWIPVTYTSQDNPDFGDTKPKVWIPDADKTYTVDNLPADGHWVMFNLQQTGYYRVNYEVSNWHLIIEQLLKNYSVIALTCRSQIIDDSLNLARAGQLSYRIALEINSYLKKETLYVPWKSALDNFEYLENMFSRRGGYGSLKSFILALLTPLYNMVGFEDLPGDSHLNHYKRVLAISWACSLSMPDCVQNSVELYSEWMANPTNLTIISPNLKSTVYCTGIGEGDEEEWDFAWHQYLISDLAQEKDTILVALACSKEIWILSRYLEMAFDPTSGVRKQDAATVYNSIARNDIGRDLAWEFLQNNVPLITSYLQTFTVIGDMVSAASHEFNTNEDLFELEQFKEQHINELGASTMAVDQSIERTTNNIAWMDNYYDFILNWLKDNGYGSLY